MNPFNTAPIFQPDLVKGFVMCDDHQRPDRCFYVLEPHPGGDRIWELDGYCIAHGDSDRVDWSVLITCPKCNNNLKLDSTRKHFEVSVRGIETAEPIRCDWPGDFGPCTWCVEFAPPKGRLEVDYRNGAGVAGKVKIDAIMRDAR